MSKNWIAGMMLILASASAHAASGVDALNKFVSGTQTLRAQFSQVVLDKNNRRQQQATGHLVLERPGKFRWVYREPHAQVLVGDGRRLWSYDEDLNQVTVRAMDDALGSSPAALLAGKSEIGKAFVLKDAGSANGQSWVEARPRSRESSFNRVLMGFKGNSLTQMKLFDQFGQQTIISFSQLQRNKPVSAATFRFEPPKGADVIGG